MTPYEKRSLISALTNALEEAKKMMVITLCQDCRFFEQGFCKRWSEIVPEEVRQTGCAEWNFDENLPPF